MLRVSGHPYHSVQAGKCLLRVLSEDFLSSDIPLWGMNRQMNRRTVNHNCLFFFSTISFIRNFNLSPWSEWFFFGFLGCYSACFVYCPTFRNTLFFPSAGLMESTRRSETSVNKQNTPGNILKTRINIFYYSNRATCIGFICANANFFLLLLWCA